MISLCRHAKKLPVCFFLNLWHRKYGLLVSSLLKSNNKISFPVPICLFPIYAYLPFVRGNTNYYSERSWSTFISVQPDYFFSLNQLVRLEIAKIPFWLSINVLWTFTRAVWITSRDSSLLNMSESKLKLSSREFDSLLHKYFIECHVLRDNCTKWRCYEKAHSVK